MHDTDRTQLELERESNDYEFEFDNEFHTQKKVCRCHSAQSGEVLDEVEEMELAAELLEVTDEEELEQFLGKFIKRIGRKVKKFVRSPIGGALVNVLKGAALSAVPGLGPVVGAATAIGSAMKGSAAEPDAQPTPEEAAEIFGLELEGLSPEDQEFEVARRFVRFGAEAVAQAANSNESGGPERTANQAVETAARQHAPGLARRGKGSEQRTRGGDSSRQRGRWERRGRHIILFDV